MSVSVIIKRAFSQKKSSPDTGVKGIVNTILHGSSGMPGTYNETYSKLLSRGKSVHELSIHNVKPEAMDDYKGLIRSSYAKISADSKIPARLFGSFTTEIGELDQAGFYISNLLLFVFIIRIYCHNAFSPHLGIQQVCGLRGGNGNAPQKRRVQKVTDQDKANASIEAIPDCIGVCILERYYSLRHR